MGTQAAFFHKTAGAIRPNATLIVAIDAQPDLADVAETEGIIQQQVDGFTPVALPPVGFVADGDAQFRRVCHVIKIEQGALTNAETIEELIVRCRAFVAAYQDNAYAARFQQAVDRVLDAEKTLWAGVSAADMRFTKAFALSLRKLMCYKDEYEVARLFVESDFKQKIADMFAPGATIRYHMAPPIFAKKTADGRPQKQEFGAWLYAAMKLLAKLRFLRGTRLDVFGYTAERKHERQLMADFEDVMLSLLSKITKQNYPVAVRRANLPDMVRGYGHLLQYHKV